MSFLRRHGFTDVPSWDLVPELAAEIRDSILEVIMVYRP